MAPGVEQIEDISGVQEAHVERLNGAGYRSYEDLRYVSADELADVEGISLALAERIKAETGGGEYTCGRCGEPTNESPSESDYAYCEGCLEKFRRTERDGVTVEPSGQAYAVKYRGERLGPCSQTKALAYAYYLSGWKSIPGVFKYRGSRSRWLLDEYLDTHPSIKSDVEDLQRLSATHKRVEQVWE